MSKLMVEPATLTERERACLEHLRQAQERQISLVQYCRERGLKVSEWYWVKQSLVRKGALASGRKTVAATEKSVGFAPVRVSASEVGEVACRIRHPSGWTIECVSWPEANWVAQVIAGAHR